MTYLEDHEFLNRRWGGRKPRIPHLHIVVSDPEQDPDRIYVVSVTSQPQGGGPQDCLVDADDHVWIRHQSYIRIRNPVEISARDLRAMITRREVTLQETVSEELLNRIWDAIEASDQAPIGMQQTIRRHFP